MTVSLWYAIYVKHIQLHYQSAPLNNSWYQLAKQIFSQKTKFPIPQIEPFTLNSRETIARLCNVIKALAAYGVQLFDTIILTAYDISMKYKVKELLNAEVMEHVAQESYEHSLHQNL